MNKEKRKELKALLKEVEMAQEEYGKALIEIEKAHENAEEIYNKGLMRIRGIYEKKVSPLASKYYKFVFAEIE